MTPPSHGLPSSKQSPLNPEGSRVCMVKSGVEIGLRHCHEEMHADALLRREVSCQNRSCIYFLIFRCTQIST